jgi:hypothetical protein
MRASGTEPAALKVLYRTWDFCKRGNVPKNAIGEFIRRWLFFSFLFFSFLFLASS